MRSGIGLALCGSGGGESFAEFLGGPYSKNETGAALCTVNALESCAGGGLDGGNVVESYACVVLQSARGVGQQSEARAHACWCVAVICVPSRGAVAARQWTPQLHPAMGKSRSRRRSVTASMRLCILSSVLCRGCDGRNIPISISSERPLRLWRAALHMERPVQHFSDGKKEQPEPDHRSEDAKNEDGGAAMIKMRTGSRPRIEIRVGNTAESHSGPKGRHEQQGETNDDPYIQHSNESPLESVLRPTD